MPAAIHENMRRAEMKNGLKVTYLFHSGFLVETENSYLLFDYWKGQIPELDAKKALFVFASHAHHDHYSKEIFKLENRCVSVTYILSSDIKKASGYWKKAENVHFIAPHESLEIEGMEINTLTSTDEGVAFVVRVDGHQIYHAGDLHWWHWPGEPEEDNTWHKNAFQKEMSYIAGQKMDCAFVPLDPRQEEAGSWGMDYYLKNVPSRYVFPMHFWEDYKMVQTYIEDKERKYLTGKLMCITAPGECFVID